MAHKVSECERIHALNFEKITFRQPAHTVPSGKSLACILRRKDNVQQGNSSNCYEGKAVEWVHFKVISHWTTM